MNAGGCVTPLVGCVLTGAISLLVACSDEDSEPTSVSSFHYVETTTGHTDGEPLDSHEEGYYRAPDAARIVGDAEYSALGLENIVIGSQVWERRSSGWQAMTTNVDCYTALNKINFILRHGGRQLSAEDETDGPIIAGEPTRRYRWTYEDAGRLLISASELSLGDSPAEREAQARTEEIFSDLAGTTELVVGKETGRVYSLTQTRDGPKLRQRTEIVVDRYDEPVEIEPPPNVPPPTELEDSSSRCPGPPGDFPWIIAAIAAVLGPLLFLGASSFVWPRRL